jgi:acyl dehydratase
MTELHPRDRWFEDWTVDDPFQGELTYVMELSRMIEFSEEFDPQPFHIDAEAAAESVFGGIIASGWHTSSALMRLNTELLGESSKPVRAGDELRLTWTVIDKRRSQSKPDRGIMRVRQELHDQDGELTASQIAIMMIKVRTTG